MSALSVLLSRAHVRLWGRRAWLLHNSHTAITLSAASTLVTRWPRGGAAHGTTPYRSTVSGDTAARMVSHADRIDPRAVEALATRAVDAARAAGATYADARLTRIVSHEYSFITGGVFRSYDEVVGVGVRVLVNGYWGFAASPFWEPDEVVQLAQDAVAQAKENMLGTPRAVDLGHIPVATGTWSTPLRIDPFTVPIEEKLDYIRYCSGLAGAYGLSFVQNGTTSGLAFARQERVVATSEGAAFTQTLYESGGVMELQLANASQECADTPCATHRNGWARVGATPRRRDPDAIWADRPGAQSADPVALDRPGHRALHHRVRWSDDGLAGQSHVGPGDPAGPSVGV